MIDICGSDFAIALNVRTASNPNVTPTIVDTRFIAGTIIAPTRIIEKIMGSRSPPHIRFARCKAR